MVPEYQALYRKYRPQRFSEVIGQAHVTETLAAEVMAGRVAHAYLFAGPRGTGKTTTARILAKVINCVSLQPGGEPCNVCDSCSAITVGTSMDVIELDAASHNKVEDVREIRMHVGTVASVGGAKRVYILDEAHMLSRAAANALLKTLEEPPEHAHFVLATTEPYKLPDTIRSRTQRFDFHSIGSETMISHLAAIAGSEGIEANTEGLSLIVRHATGSARDALGMLEQVAAIGDGVVDPRQVSRALGLADAEVFDRLVDAVARQDPAAGLTLIAEAASAGADMRRFATDTLEQLRGVFLAQYAPNLEEVVDEPADVVAEWRRLAQRLGAAEVLRCIDLLGLALVDLREGREDRLVVELAVLKMTRPEIATDLPSLVTRVDRLEERMRRSERSDEAAPTPPAETKPARSEQPPPPPPPSPVVAEETTPARTAAEPPQTPEAAEESADESGEDAAPAASDPVPVPVQAKVEATSGAEEEVASPPAPLADAAPLDLSLVVDKWPVIVARVRDEAGPRRFAMFRDATPTRTEESLLVLSVPGPFHRDQLREDDELRGVVQSVLADSLGTNVRVDYEASEEEAPTIRVVEDASAVPDDLEDSDEGAIDPTKLVVDLLGGEVVSE